MMKFLVKGQRLEIVEREVIASGQITFVTLKYGVDHSWKPLHKVIQFTQDDENFYRVLGVDGLSLLAAIGASCRCCENDYCGI